MPVCLLCGIQCKNVAGLKRHAARHARHPNITPLNHLYGAFGFSCQECGADFSSQRGLSQHCRRKHPNSYNQTRLASMPTSKYYWSRDEDHRLLAAASSICQSSANLSELHSRLREHFPSRSKEAIKKRLQKLHWRQQTILDNATPGAVGSPDDLGSGGRSPISPSPLIQETAHSPLINADTEVLDHPDNQHAVSSIPIQQGGSRSPENLGPGIRSPGSLPVLSSRSQNTPNADHDSFCPRLSDPPGVVSLSIHNQGITQPTPSNRLSALSGVVSPAPICISESPPQYQTTEPTMSTPSSSMTLHAGVATIASDDQSGAATMLQTDISLPAQGDTNEQSGGYINMESPVFPTAMAEFLQTPSHLSPSDPVCFQNIPLSFLPLAQPPSIWDDSGAHFSMETPPISCPEVAISPLSPSLNLLLSAREQLTLAPENDKFRELLPEVSKTILESDDLRSLQNSLEDFAQHHFPATWKRRIHRTQSRSSIMNNKTFRRLQYSHVQRLYRNRRSDAAKTILDGRWRNAFLENNDIFPNFTSYWKETLSGDSPTDDRPPRMVLPEITRLIDPITPEEVSSAITGLMGSASGMDHITPIQLRQMPSTSLAAFFNLMLASGYIPRSLNTARLTFVPKTSNPLSPSDFRPISVTSTLTRCFHKILFNRWSPNFPSDRGQFGFLQQDGCFEITSILHAILRNTHAHSKDICIAFADISKAFDRVSHSSILRNASSFGAPTLLIHYLTHFYTSGTTYLDGEPISCRRGVRQGDPLSPLLFIMALDEALQNSTDFPFHTPAGPLPHLAYADDCILLSHSPESLTRRLYQFNKELHALGLSLNILKTSTLHICANGRAKSVALDTSPIFINSEPLPVISPDSTINILGIPFSWSGKSPTDVSLRCSDMLNELRQAPLKPQQRIDILQHFLMPRLIHCLSLGAVHKNTLRKLDVKIRQNIKAWLRLPKDTATAFFYASVEDNGLGIPNLSTRVPLNRRRRLERHLSSPNPTLAWALRDPTSAPSHYLATSTISVAGNPISDLKSATTAWANALYSSVDSAPLRHVSTTPTSHDWLRNPQRIFPRLYIRAIQLRAGVLSTKSRRARGHRIPAEDIKCRACATPETLSHILQTCPLTHDARCRRHNEIVHMTIRKSSKRHITTMLEPHIPTARSFLKPDLLVVSNTNVFVADVAVCDPPRMERTYQEKSAKYGAISDQTLHAVNRFHPGVRTIIQCPLIFSNRGHIHPTSQKHLLRLGFTKLDISDLCVATIQGSLKTFDTYMRGSGTA